MESEDTIKILSALAHETRLRIFRSLVRSGPEGMRAGDVALALGVPGTTLSFHLKEMKHAGVVTCRRHGRELIYGANFEAMQGIIAYLTENCCAGTEAPPS